LMRQVKAKLLFHSLKPCSAGGAFWSKRYVEAIRTMAYPTASLRAAVGALLDAREYVTKQIAGLNRKIVALSRTEFYRERVGLLRTIPGIGLLTAMEILTELGDVIRFPTNEHLASFLGLTSSEYSSAPFVRHGRITRCGNTRLRSTLVESAWYLVRRGNRSDGLVRTTLSCVPEAVGRTTVALPWPRSPQQGRLLPGQMADAPVY
jgi:transposase